MSSTANALMDRQRVLQHAFSGASSIHHALLLVSLFVAQPPKKGPQLGISL